MKFLKIKRSEKKSVFQSLGEFAIAIVVFVTLLFLIPNTNNTDNSKTSPTMQFVFHDSAEQWEEFFEANELDDILSGELKDSVIERLDEDGDDDHSNSVIKTGCVLPRFGHTIEHGETVLAYEQRDDVNTICNIERRICNDGELLGSFAQRSCKETVVYNYIKEPVISYNQKIIDPLVQPTPPPYISAQFSTEGKRNEILVPTTTRNNTINDAKTIEIYGNGQLSTAGTYCRTARGERVNNRQFVKAYRSAFGFTNALCEVEIRYCEDGQLQGSFDYQYCEHTDMVREDFLLQSQDGESPYRDIEPLQLLDSLK